MNPATAFARGFTAPIHAATLLQRSRGVKRFAVLPLLVNVLVYVLLIALFIWLLGKWDLQVGEWEFWGGFGAWLASVLDWLLDVFKWLIAIPLIFAVCYFTFILVGMIVASPFNDMLSERVERKLCHPKEDPNLPLRVTGKLMILGIFDGLAILGRELLFMLLVLPLVFIPLVGFLPLFFVGAYFSGLGFFDYSMARNYLRNRHKDPVIRSHRWEMLGLGTAMQLLFLIPFLGLLMLPIGVTAGTMLYCDIDWERELAEAGLAKPVGFVPPKPVVEN